MEAIKTMTIEEATERLRALGMKMSPSKLRNGIQQGVYPFGDAVMMDKHPSFEIYTVLFEAWVEKRLWKVLELASVSTNKSNTNREEQT